MTSTSRAVDSRFRAMAWQSRVLPLTPKCYPTSPHTQNWTRTLHLRYLEIVLPTESVSIFYHSIYRCRWCSLLKQWRWPSSTLHDSLITSLVASRTKCMQGLALRNLHDIYGPWLIDLWTDIWDWMNRWWIVNALYCSGTTLTKVSEQSKPILTSSKSFVPLSLPCR